MDEPSEHKTENTITSDQPSEQPGTEELTEKQLDEVSGGGGKATAVADESPKETVTFVYGQLGVQYQNQG